MIVQCEHCKTKFRLADDRVSHGGVKVRCSKCAHVFTVSRSASDGRIEAKLVDPTSSERPMSPLEARSDALAGDLMLPGGAGLTGGLGGAPPGAFGGAPPGAFGGAPPGAFGGPSAARGPAAGLPGSALDGAWPAALSPPPTFGALPPLPFDVGPPPPVGRPAPGPIPRPPVSAVPVIPAGRPPPGHTLPSVPRALLDADPSGSEPAIDLDISSSGRTISDDSGSGAFESRTDVVPRPGARASTEVVPPRGSPMGRGPTQVDPLRSPPQARAATELEGARRGGVGPAPELPGGPRALPPSSLSPQSIKAPTFPPPPVFDPLGGPLASAPPPPPSMPPVAATRGSPGLGNIPGADSDRFALPRPADPLSNMSPSDMFGGAFVGGSAAQMGDLSFESGDEHPAGGAKLARIELRKGLLGTAGVSTFGAANEQTTRIAASIKAADDDATMRPQSSILRSKLATNIRSALALAGLFVIVGIAVLVVTTRRETRVGEPSLIENLLGSPPPLVQGALLSVHVESARVSSYPLRDPQPRLVVSGRVGNDGAEVSGALEVVATMLDGDRVVAQQVAPLGVRLPLDALARARTAAELEAAWGQVERVAKPWARGETRDFMVVFPELPSEVERYTFRVDVRSATTAVGQR